MTRHQLKITALIMFTGMFVILAFTDLLAMDFLWAAGDTACAGGFAYTLVRVVRGTRKAAR